MIEGYVGLIGAGKTMLAVRHAGELAQRRGALLLSNIKLVPPEGVDFVQLGVGDDGLDMTQLHELLDGARAAGRGAVLMLDEVGILMPARFWQSFPIRLMHMLSQSRKLSIDLIYTAQDVEQIDTFLRRLTQWIYRVACWPESSVERREKGKRPRFFIVGKWRPTKIGKRDAREGLVWRRYRRADEGSYDTDELVWPPARLGVTKKARVR